MSVDWAAGKARVRHDPRCSTDDLVRAVERASSGTRHRYQATVVATRGT